MSANGTGRHSRVAPSGPVPWLTVGKLSVKVIAAMVSVLLIVGFWYGWKNYRDLDHNLRRLGGVDALGAGPSPAAGETEPPDIDGIAQNILVLGNDDRNDMTDAEVKALHTGRDGGSLNTDTMLIVHVPADGSKATLISFPRDSYVDIPGFRKNKLNAAYPDGYYNTDGADTEDEQKAAGVNQLVKTLKQLTGLRIDHFVQVDLLGFYRIAKAIGKVTVNLCKRVDDSKSGLHLDAGINHLDAVQSLAFVRQRYGVPGSDLGREKRQRYFLTAAYRQLASVNTFLHPGKLIDAVDKSIYVDDGFSLTSLLEQMANLSADNIVGQNIPYESEQIVDGVGDVLIVDPAKVKTFVQNMIHPARAVADDVRAYVVVRFGVEHARITEHVEAGARRGLHPVTPEQSFADLLGAAPAQPFVTYYDEASGERTELSVRSLGNWVAKTHFLLVDELGLGVGARAFVDLPAHWISVPAVLGCLTAGLALVTDPADADVAFVGRGTVPAGVPDVYAIAPGSAAVGFRDAVPAGASDYVVSVRPQADAWGAVRFTASPSDEGLDGRTRAEVVEAARGLPPGARALTTRDWTTAADLVETLLGPLVAGGSVVYVRNAPDEAVVERRIAQERATVRL